MNRSMEQIKEKVEELQLEANNLGVILNIDANNFYEFMQHCIWYGGEIASVEYRGMVVYVQANGDVDADLYDENGEHITHTKDKGNNGNFFHNMRDYIKNDEELIQLLGWNYDATSDIKPRLELTDNNWIEYEIYDTKNQEWVELGDCGVIDETDDVLDAIDIPFMIELIDDYFNEK